MNFFFFLLQKCILDTNINDFYNYVYLYKNQGRPYRRYFM